MMSIGPNPLEQPTQQHLRHIEQIKVKPSVPTHNQTALAEAQLEAHLNQTNLRSRQLVQQHKNIFLER